MIIGTTDEEEYLSKEFKEIMLTENIYCVKISTPPENFLNSNIPFEEPFKNSSFFSIRGNFINVYNDDFDDWHSFFFHKFDINKFYKTYNREISPVLLLVKTGESTDYVREFLTDEKIPVVYYNKNQDSHYNFYNDKGKIRTSYIRAFEIENSYDFKTKSCGSRISNFNNFNLLSSFSKEEIKNLLKEYKRAHIDNEEFKDEIKSIFERNEKRINNIIKEREKNIELKKIIEENKLIKIYRLEKK